MRSISLRVPTVALPLVTLLRGALLGVALGLPVLGVGGRLVMRGIAWETGAASAFTLGGTLTVLMSGAGSGALGGAIRALLDLVRPLSTTVRALLFSLLCALLVWRGLNPVDAVKVKWFTPVALLFVLVFEWRWRVKNRSSQGVMAEHMGAPSRQEG